MKIYVFVFLMVIQALNSEKALSKLRRKLVVPKLNDKCKKIKCAAVEEPQCVKLRRQDLGIDVHIIVVNKCELDYIKCHDDVEAKIVPMKYCGHVESDGVPTKKNKTSKINKRVKRRVLRDHPTTESGVQPLGDPTKVEEMNKYNAGKNGTHRAESIHTAKNIASRLNVVKESTADEELLLKLRHLKNEASNMISGDSKLQRNDRAKNIVPKTVLVRESASKINSKLYSRAHSDERTKISKGIAGHRIDLDETNKDLMIPKIHADDEGLHWDHGSLPMKTGERNHASTVFPMLSMESTNYSADLLSEADRKEYDEVVVCPTACPSRDVMVCARCQHGIFKTFLSLCHMRMFKCNHDDEELELVSRYPCVLSAPYLSDPDMKPKGRIAEPGDNDRILHFIICRDRNNLEVPRCKNFERDTENPSRLKNAVYGSLPKWFSDEDYDTA